MPLDNVLLRFAGQHTTDQTQSVSGGRFSEALPTKFAKYEFNTEAITGDYPISGIEFMDAYPGSGSWVGYENFRIELTLIANHGTATYNIRYKIRLPGSGTDDYTYTNGASITVPSGFTVDDEFIILYMYQSQYLKLKVTLSALPETAGTTYVFFVPGAVRANLPAFKQHTGGVLSSHVPTQGVDSPCFGALEHCLQLISIRSDSATSVRIGYGLNSGGYVTARLAGQWLYGSSGDLNFTGGIRYLRYAYGAYGIVLRYDTDEAERTICISSYSGAQSRFNSFSTNTFYTDSLYRAKNELFPPAYRNNIAYRGFYFENITESELQVYISRVGSADGLWFNRNRLQDPDVYWLIGDGITTGVPGADPSIGNLPIDNTPTGPITIPARQFAAFRFSFESSATTSVESITQLLILSS